MYGTIWQPRLHHALPAPPRPCGTSVRNATQPPWRMALSHERERDIVIVVRWAWPSPCATSSQPPWRGPLPAPPRTTTSLSLSNTHAT